MVEVEKTSLSKKSSLRKALMAQTAFSLLTASYYVYVGPARFFSWDKPSASAISIAMGESTTNPINAAKGFTELALAAKSNKHPLSKVWLDNKAIKSMATALNSDINAIAHNDERFSTGKSEDYKRSTLRLLRAMETDLEISRHLAQKLDNKAFESILNGWLKQASELRSKLK
jgi:signal transduction histidine kinase